MNTYTLKNEENEEIMGIKIITIQFTKIEECDNIELKKWLDLITRKDFSKYEGSEGMMEAAKKILTMNSDEKTMHQLLKEEMKYLDEMSEKKAIEIKLNNAKEEGMREGLEQGLEQGMMLEKKEIVLNMHEKGYSKEIISEITKLTKEEIEDIIKSL